MKKGIPLISAIVKRLLLFIFAPNLAFSESTPNPTPWTVYYSDQASAREFLKYDLIVLDSHYHPPLSYFAHANKKVIGYISLGEVEQYRSHFQTIKDQGLLIEENPHWKGSFSVDVRSNIWKKMVIEELIPAILAKGFDGLFFDTLDNPIYLEEREPEKFKGMTKAAAELVQAIRYHYPDIYLMMNRGYKLIDSVGADIDSVLGECVFADYDFESKIYSFVENDLYTYQRDLLQKAQRQFENLRIYTLDYWDPEDIEGVKKIYLEQKNNGFSPYVSTIKLNKIFPEPQ